MTREAASPATDYNKNPESEWNRLEKDAYHRIEYEVVTHYLWESVLSTIETRSFNNTCL